MLEQRYRWSIGIYENMLRLLMVHLHRASY